MKYLPFIFENQEVKYTIAKNEAIVEAASAQIINMNVLLEDYIYDNLHQFTNCENNLTSVYENIRDFVVNANVNSYLVLSEIMASPQLNDSEKLSYIYEISGELIKTAIGDTLKKGGGSLKTTVVNAIKDAAGKILRAPKQAYDNMRQDIGGKLKSFGPEYNDRAARSTISELLNKNESELARAKKYVDDGPLIDSLNKNITDLNRLRSNLREMRKQTNIDREKSYNRGMRVGAVGVGAGSIASSMADANYYNNLENNR